MVEGGENTGVRHSSWVGSVGSVDGGGWDLSLGNFRRKLSLGNFCLGPFAWKLSFGIFRLGTFDWELSFWEIPLFTEQCHFCLHLFTCVGCCTRQLWWGDDFHMVGFQRLCSAPCLFQKNAAPPHFSPWIGGVGGLVFAHPHQTWVW